MTSAFCFVVFNPERPIISQILKLSKIRNGESAASESQLSVKSNEIPRLAGSPSVLSKWICRNGSLKLNPRGHLRRRMVSGALNHQLTDESVGYYRSEVSNSNAQ